MKKIVLGGLLIFFGGCSAGDIQTIATIAMSKDPVTAATSIAKRKAINYTSIELAKIIDEFTKRVEKEWGKEAKTSSPKEYAKYTQNYKSMAYVNFDTGEILVQTIDTQTPLKSLKNAIISTLLTSDDPRAVDLYSDAKVKLSTNPYLYKTVMDHTGNYIRSQTRASNFADFLIKHHLQTKSNQINNTNQTIHYIKIQMVQNHIHVRAKRYLPLVKKYSSKYNISQNLIFAIMKTESDFNPFAISSANAIGLMQIVPTSAGKDVYNFIYKKNITPSRDFLYDANNNIQFGSAYLHILDNNYLKNIKDPISREYCIIAGYNTGSGNVLRTFSTNRNSAFDIINNMSPNEVYKKLQSSLPYDETKNYLFKVLQNKKDFINL
jgi:membrane-bound lytic murein transglycosylase C